MTKTRRSSPRQTARKWWTYAGGRGNRLLAGALQSRLGEKVTASNEAVRLSGEASKSVVAIREAIHELASGPPLTWADAARWTEVSENARVSKFQACLPEHIEQELVARELMDVADAKAALGASSRAGGSSLRLEAAEVEALPEGTRT